MPSKAFSSFFAVCLTVLSPCFASAATGKAIAILPQDARDPHVIAVKKIKTVSNWKTVPSDEICGTDAPLGCGQDKIVPAGFVRVTRVTVEFKSWLAGATVYDSRSEGPVPTEDAQVDVDLPMGSRVTGLKLEPTAFEGKAAVDYCPRDTESNKLDPSCQDREVIVPGTTPAKRLTVEYAD